MILILESYNASNCFYSINNPDRIASTWIGNRKIGDVSVHDYMKFEKGEDAEVVYMTGDEYIQHCIDDIFHSNYTSVVTNAVDFDKVNEYANEMKNRAKFPIPYLNIKARQQEGRHRALAVKEAFGEDAVLPVIVIKQSQPTQEEIAEYAETRWGKENKQLGINYVNSILYPNLVQDNEDYLNDTDFKVKDTTSLSDLDIDEFIVDFDLEDKLDISNITSLSDLLHKVWDIVQQQTDLQSEQDNLDLFNYSRLLDYNSKHYGYDYLASLQESVFDTKNICVTEHFEYSDKISQGTITSIVYETVIDGDYEDTFTNKEEAIKYVKDFIEQCKMCHSYVGKCEVKRTEYIETYNGTDYNIDIRNSEIVWSNH